MWGILVYLLIRSFKVNFFKLVLLFDSLNVINFVKFYDREVCLNFFSQRTANRSSLSSPCARCCQYQTAFDFHTSQGTSNCCVQTACNCDPAGFLSTLWLLESLNNSAPVNSIVNIQPCLCAGWVQYREILQSSASELQPLTSQLLWNWVSLWNKMKYHADKKVGCLFRAERR